MLRSLPGLEDELDRAAAAARDAGRTVPLHRLNRSEYHNAAHLTRYHGVFAPASPDRARVVPKTRAAAEKSKGCDEAGATDRQRALTWAQRLKRVFAIDIETCRRCGGKLRVIASDLQAGRCAARRTPQ